MFRWFDRNKSYEELVRVRLFRRRMLQVLYALLFIGCALYLMSPFYSFAFNGTNSLPGYVYLIEKGVPPKKGEVFAFKPPPNRYPDGMNFIKYVAGRHGDLILYEENRIYVDGHDLGEVKSITSGGDSIEKSESGLIPPRHFFMWTPSEFSYDSRYKEIGLIHESDFIGRAYRII